MSSHPSMMPFSLKMVFAILGLYFFMFDLAMDVIVKQHRELKDHLKYKDHGTKLETTPSGSGNSGHGIPLS